MKGNMDMASLMKQAQQMQGDMQKIQEDLKERVVEASSGGGAVTVMVSGAGEVVSIKLNEDVVDPEDIETLEDLILTAVNNGVKDAKEMSDKEMSRVTGGMGLPGMF